MNLPPTHREGPPSLEHGHLHPEDALPHQNKVTCNQRLSLTRLRIPTSRGDPPSQEYKHLHPAALTRTWPARPWSQTSSCEEQVSVVYKFPLWSSGSLGYFTCLQRTKSRRTESGEQMGTIHDDNRGGEGTAAIIWRN